eukprot:2830276-Pyramimonas_sp.AAC.1
MSGTGSGTKSEKNSKRVKLSITYGRQIHNLHVHSILHLRGLACSPSSAQKPHYHDGDKYFYKQPAISIGQAATPSLAYDAHSKARVGGASSCEALQISRAAGCVTD